MLSNNGTDDCCFQKIEVNWEDHLIIIETKRLATSQHSNEPERPVLLVATPGPEGVDPLGGELGHRRGAGQLEFPLLPGHFVVDGMIFPLSRMFPITHVFRNQIFSGVVEGQ